MDDKLRSEVMDDIENFVERGVQPFTQVVANRYRQVMTDYGHLETESLQMKAMLLGMMAIFVSRDYEVENDDEFALLSHAKAFLEENP